MNIDIYVRVTVKNAISEEDLEELGISLEEYTRQMLLDEGLCGIIEDDYDIIDVERGDD